MKEIHADIVDLITELEDERTFLISAMGSTFGDTDSLYNYAGRIHELNKVILKLKEMVGA